MSNIRDARARDALRQAHAYMFPEKEQAYITEAYVCSPPAARITDERNDVFALGYTHLPPEAGAPNGEFAFCILRNGVETGEFASRIERRNGKVRIFTRQGYKVWNGHSFV